MEIKNSLSILTNPSTEPQNGLQSSSENWLPSALCKAADPDTAKTQALCVQAYNGNTVGAMVRRDARLAFGVKIDLEFCAATYCGAPNTLPETIEEGVKFVLSQFSHLAITEIREAFRLAAAGKIDANLSAFYGLFTVQMLGSILHAYDDYRTGIFREVRAKMMEAEGERENEQRAEVMREKHGTIADQFNQLRVWNNKYEKWQDLPEWFCRRVVEDDLAGLTNDEKGKAWVAAKHYTANSVRGWLLEQDTDRETRKRYAAAVSALDKSPDIFPDELKKEAQEVYCKMLVFQKIAPYEK